MPLKTDDDQKSDIDQGYKKGLDSGGQAYQPDSDIKTDGDSVNKMLKDASQYANNPANSRESIDNAEKNPQESQPEAGSIPYKNTKNSKSRKFSLKNLKKWGPVAAITSTMAVSLASLTLFFSLHLGPIAFIENVTDDLNDSLAAMDIADGKLTRNKIPRAERRQAVKGCTKMSIRCKFATVSDKQIAKLNKAGIEVTGEKTAFGRTIPESYKFQGQTFDPENWSNQLDTNRGAQQAQRRANNMKYLGVADSTFATKVLKRFGISRRPPELRGSAQDRVNILLNKAGVTNAKDIRFIPIDKDGNQLPSEDGAANYILDGDTTLMDPDDPNSRRVYSVEETNEMRAKVDRIANQKPPSAATKASIGALSILGYWDLACSISNMIGAASLAASVAGQVEMIRFAMQIASKTHEMKAGDISAEDAEALGEFFSQTDARKFIPAIGTAVSDYGVPSSGELGQEKNPNYGKNALDSGLHMMSVMGGVATPEPMFSHGFGQKSLLAAFATGAEISKTLANIGTPDNAVCGFVQHGAVRLVGFVAAIAAGVSSGGGSVAFQAAIAGVMIGAMIILEIILNNALKGSLIESADLLNDTVARGSAVWSGKAGIQSVNAQNRGLTPGNLQQIVAYQEETKHALNEYAALEREDADPFDIYSQHSFLGSFARIMMQNSPSSSSVLIPGSLFSFIKGGIFSPLTSFASANSTINPERFQQCDAKSLKDIGIDADVQCNVRMVMPKSALSLEPDKVAQWMEDNGYVEPDTETGLPRGYTSPDPAVAQEDALSFVTGIATGAIESFVNLRAVSVEDYNDYAKFLDYCAYRTMPFGETYNDNATSIGSVSRDWQTGQKCMENSTMIDHFRMYTLYKSTDDSYDLEDAPPEDTTGSGEYTISPDVSSNWAHPSDNRTYGPVFMSSAYRGEYRINHLGVDIKNTSGEPVYSACDGVVTEVNITPKTSQVAYTYSNAIVVSCGGNVVTTYNHTPSIQGIAVGVRVTAGQQIGTSDNSGMATGAHLHFNVKVNDEFIDPVPFMSDRGINLGTCTTWCNQ